MVLPLSGQISASEIITLLTGGIAQFDINATDSRNLATVPSGQIRYSDFWGKSLGGNTNFSPASGYGCGTPYTFLTPGYSQITFTLNAGGGGGGGGDNHNIYGIGNNGYNGAPGGATVMTFPGFSAQGDGGPGGIGSAPGNVQPGGGGSSSTGGGSVVAGGGGAGGAGGAPQQGGAWGGAGGAGGQMNYTFNYTDPVRPIPGTTINFQFGCGGGAAPQNAAPGQPGNMFVIWT
jgi:hypothetical protein